MEYPDWFEEWSSKEKYPQKYIPIPGDDTDGKFEGEL